MLDSGEKHCFAHNRAIARRARTTTKYVSAAISKLVELEYLNVVRPPDKAGMGRVLEINPDMYKKYEHLRIRMIEAWRSVPDGN